MYRLILRIHEPRANYFLTVDFFWTLLNSQGGMEAMNSTKWKKTTIGMRLDSHISQSDRFCRKIQFGKKLTHDGVNNYPEANY